MLSNLTSPAFEHSSSGVSSAGSVCSAGGSVVAQRFRPSAFSSASRCRRGKASVKGLIVGSNSEPPSRNTVTWTSSHRTTLLT